MSRSNLMPIGRFAESVRLSVKALRNYDELGLLEPAHVDASSGYRYYARDQVRPALLISMLRSLDLPLAVIREALAADEDALRRLVDTESARIEAEVAARQAALLSLQHLAQQGGLAGSDIEVRVEPARHVAKLTGRTTTERLISDTTELVYALIDDVAGAGRSEPFAINQFLDAAGHVAVEVCMDVEPKAELTRAAHASLEGGPFACLRHEGPYETLALAYHALWAWLQEHGHDSRGSIWEIYVNDPADVASEALITDVRMPLVAPA